MNLYYKEQFGKINQKKEKEKKFTPRITSQQHENHPYTSKIKQKGLSVKKENKDT